MGLKNNRMNVSFRPEVDKDLIDVLENVPHDFSRFVRDLLRDGIRYRAMGGMELKKPLASTAPPPQPEVKPAPVMEAPVMEAPKKEKKVIKQEPVIEKPPITDAELDDF